ncbi:hypothetical protein P5V15_003946 [Pogonomyrmex californicus]
MKHSLFAILILSMATIIFGAKIIVQYEWKYVNFTWDSMTQMANAVKSGHYDFTKCLLYDADKWPHDNRIFVTIPKEAGPGSPATLAIVSNKRGPEGPRLTPYPDWSWHNCKCNDIHCIVNVHRIHVKCNYIFVLDNGKIGMNQVCNPKLLVFNLSNNKLVKTIYIPSDLANNKAGSGWMLTPYVHAPKGCSRLLDTMIVNLFYSAISSKEMYKMRIEDILKCPNKETANKQTKFVKKLSSQTGPIASDGCALMYSDTTAMSIKGMNVCKKDGAGNAVVLAQNSITLQAVSGLKTIVGANTNKKNDILIALSDRFQKFAKQNINFTEINFRYLETKLSEVKKEIN